MTYAIIKRSVLEQFFVDGDIVAARTVAERNARTHHEEFVVITEIGSAVPQETISWVEADKFINMVAAPQPPPSTKADTVTPAQEKPAKGAARRVEQPVTAAQPTQPLFTEPAPATAATNGVGRPKNPQIRGVKLPVNVLDTAEGAQPFNAHQRAALVAEEARLGITVEGTIKDWVGYPLDQLSAETVDCLLQILAKFPTKQ